MVHGRLYAFLLGFGNFSGANLLLNFGGCNCLSLGVTYQKKDLQGGPLLVIDGIITPLKWQKINGDSLRLFHL